MKNINLNEKLNSLKNAEYEKVVSCVKKHEYFTHNWKRNECHLFWKSELPIKFFNEFKKAPFFDNYLFGYFSHESHTNERFLRLFADNGSLEQLKRIIKLSKAYENERHWQSFSFFESKQELKVFYKEIRFIKAYNKDWEEKEECFKNKLNRINYEDILIQTVSYFEKFKRYSLKTCGNKENQISYEIHVISVLKTILNIKQTHEMIDEGYTVEEFREIVTKELPPKRPIESYVNLAYKPCENISKKKKIIRSIIDFFLAQEIAKYQIENYLTGLVDFQIIEGLEAELRPNNYFSNYRLSLEKGVVDENYFVNKVIDNDPSLKGNGWDKGFIRNTESSKLYFNYLAIPIELKIKKSKQKIDLEKVLLFLQTFSCLSMPQGRISVCKEVNSKAFVRDIPNRFKKLFYSEYIICFEEEDFIKKCALYFKWEELEIKTILTYLLTDLSILDRKEIDIFKQPFIKLNNKIIWLSTFMRDRRWEILLHKKISQNKDEKPNLYNQPSNSESYIAELFKKAGFSAISSHNYKWNGRNGEIDILAYKQNTLFIIELKSTFIEEDILKTTIYKTLKFASKAATQLEKAKAFCINNFDSLLQLEELKIDCKKEELKVESFIVSNIYESDHVMFKNQYKKISLFELVVILKNDLYNCLVSKVMEGESLVDVEEFYNKKNPKYKSINTKINEEDCSLWEDRNTCSPSDILSAIVNNKVWSNFENRKVHTHNDISLTMFDSSKKYLD